MIQKETMLNVADNTGAKAIKCISVIGIGKRRTAKIGDIITASVKVAIPRGMVKKKEVVRAVIVRTKKGIAREDGSVIRFDQNCAVILKEDQTPQGTRIFGPVPRELRERFSKIISMAPEVL